MCFIREIWSESTRFFEIDGTQCAVHLFETILLHKQNSKNDICDVYDYNLNSTSRQRGG